VPQYDDTDSFTLGGDDLVPLLVDDSSGGLTPYEEAETIDGVPHRVRRYLPRTLIDHSRIEQCIDSVTGDTFWRTVSRDNVTRTFGRTPASRVHDPRDPSATRFVAEWLLDTVRDDLGNIASYEYKSEDTAGVTPSIFEQARLTPGAPVQAAKHLKHVRYANSVADDASSCAIHVVVDYGEHDLAPDEVRPWVARPDPFSSHRAGFELRTWRLVRRLLVFHNFGADSGPGPRPRLVRSLELTHDLDPVASLLRSVRQVGYSHDGAVYTTVDLPPVEMDYGVATAATSPRDAQLLAVPEGSHPRWIDLDGDGMPGVLHTRQGSWWYQAPAGQGRFHPPRLVVDLPVSARSPGTPALGDVDGTSRLAATSSGALPGTSTLQPDGSWGSWRPYVDRAVEPTTGPGSRMLDLDGDGLTDLATVGPHGLVWRRSTGRDGFERARTVFAVDDDPPPQPSTDTEHEWFVADITGDGLPDVVHVRNGSVDYWPGRGPGHHGRRMRMASAPVFDTPDQFDPSRLRFADLSGTGTCDLIYVGRDGVTRWLNESGNSWSAPERIPGVPTVRSSDDLQVADLLGTGTPCLMWTTALPHGPLCLRGPATRARDLPQQPRRHDHDHLRHRSGLPSRRSQRRNPVAHQTRRADAGGGAHHRGGRGERVDAHLDLPLPRGLPRPRRARTARLWPGRGSRCRPPAAATARASGGRPAREPQRHVVRPRGPRSPTRRMLRRRP
jgi:hypothetical protein